MQTFTEMFYEHNEVMHLFLDTQVYLQNEQMHSQVHFITASAQFCLHQPFCQHSAVVTQFSWPGVNRDPPIDGDDAFVQGHSRIHMKTKDNGMFS